MTLADLDEPALARQFEAWGFKPGHAARVLRAHYAGIHRGADAPSWARLPAGLLDRLTTAFRENPIASSLRQLAGDGTVKLLSRFDDGRSVESVLMPDHRPDRAAGCLSSQVGCAMGCDFCATAQGGFDRNLTVGEIVAQFILLRREAQAVGRRLQTVVFMGMGEPMLNLGNVIEAASRLASNQLGGLGSRQITVSTVGIVPGIEALAASGLGANLALSLHAPDDATRARLLPVGRRYGVAEILEAATRYMAVTGRLVTIQYCLLAGVNDSEAQARELAAAVGRRRMHINLLRYNPTGVSLRGVAYEPSPDAVAEAFAATLRAAGQVAHFRRPRGRDIDAACGQLRHRASTGSAAALAAG